MTFQCPGAEGEPERRFVGTGGKFDGLALDGHDNLTIEWGPVSFTTRFYKPIKVVSAVWAVLEPDREVSRLQLSVVKMDKGHWPQPFAQKFNFVVKDWEKWVSELEEENEDVRTDSRGNLLPNAHDLDMMAKAEQMAAGAASIVGAKDAKEAARNTFTLKVDPLPEEADDDERAGNGWLSKYREFGMRQKMLTMALMWNALKPVGRVAAAKHLVAILKAGNADMRMMEAAIKGGDFGRLKLDTTVYACELRPQQWIESFEGASQPRQLEIMAAIFMQLTFEEQKVVVGTFV